MKYTFLTLLFVSLLSCKDEKKETPPIKVSASNIAKNEAYQDLYGSWVGDFVAIDYDENKDYVQTNKINIVIKKIE
jgi:hypothetical protein